MAKTYGLIFTNSDPRQAPATSLAPTLVIFNAIDGTVVSTPGITKPISTVGLYTFNYRPSLAVYFLADGGAAITDNTQRYLSGILDPIQEVDEQLQFFTTTFTAANITLLGLGLTGVALGTTNVAIGTTGVALGLTSIAIDIALGASILAQGSTNQAFGQTGVALGTTILGYATSLYAQSTTILASVTTSALNSSLILASIGTTASPIGTTVQDPGNLFGYLKRLQEFNEGNASFNKTSGVWTIQTRGTTTFAVKTLNNNNTQVTKA